MKLNFIGKYTCFNMLSVALIYFLFWPFSASLLCCTLLQYRGTVHCSAFEDCITLTYLHSSPWPFSISVLMTCSGRAVTEILTNGTALDFHSTHRGQMSYRLLRGLGQAMKEIGAAT